MPAGILARVPGARGQWVVEPGGFQAALEQRVVSSCLPGTDASSLLETNMPKKAAWKAA
jgi:hypothetical protein